MDDIKSGWDVAHLVMHSAFDELGVAATFCRVDPLDPQMIAPMDCFFFSRTNHASTCRGENAIWLRLLLCSKLAWNHLSTTGRSNILK